MKKIAPRFGLEDLADQWTFINPFQAAGLKIPDDGLPYRLSLALNHAVDILHALLRNHRGVDAPHDRWNTPLSINRGNFISSRGLTGKGSDPHKVGFIKPEGLEILIEDLDFPVGRSEGCNNSETQWLVAGFTVDMKTGPELVGRIDEHKGLSFHRFNPSTSFWAV